MKTPKRRPGRRPDDQPPDLCYYAPRNQAVVYLGGKRVYLGQWGSNEAKAAYKSVIAEWESRHRISRVFRPSGSLVTVADLVAAFLSHAEVYYRRADGQQTAEVRHFRNSLAPLLSLGSRPISQLRFEDVKAIVDGWVAADLERGYVNQMLGRVKCAMKWGKEQRLVPKEVFADIADVPRLKKGRSLARETEPIVAANLLAVRAAMRHLTPALRLVVIVQLRTGARPGEVCAMRAAEIHRREAIVDGRTIAVPDGVWAFVPREQKNKWRGKSAAYAIGPKLRRRLIPLLGQEFLFPGERIDFIREDWYAAKVQEACAAASLGDRTWTPNQLRHTYLSRRNRRAGRDAARASVGHTSALTTDGYIDRDLTEAAKHALRWD